jgi:hypothetical protein
MIPNLSFYYGKEKDMLHQGKNVASGIKTGKLGKMSRQNLQSKPTKHHLPPF